MFQLISPAELKQRLATGSSISIIDARRKYEFSAGHIPGATCMRWEQWCEAAPETASSIMKQPGWWGKLGESSGAQFAERLGSMGLNNDRHIIVYADGARTKGRNARIAWMLLYLGAQNVSLLNGGWQGWTEIGGSQQAQIEQPVERSFELQLFPERRISLAALKSDRNLVAIDTRTTEEFTGHLYDYQPRKGRIPGSLSLPFSGLYKENGQFLSKDEFLDFANGKNTRHQYKIDKMDYSYCEVGVRAAAFSLLYELYTGAVLPVYDGSFMEWSFDKLLDIEVGF